MCESLFWCNGKRQFRALIFSKVSFCGLVSIELVFSFSFDHYNLVVKSLKDAISSVGQSLTTVHQWTEAVTL